MSNPIRILAPEVADAIAAGEVVERPASVVKELVENSIDAGARRIEVDIVGAGKGVIRVADDGGGIPPAELALAFRRHATSKVAAIGDLDAISSFGFRGEALASIAAVSDVECRSRGSFVRIRAGAEVDHGSSPVAAGTVVEVRDLFANTPARLAFLKTDSTETSAILASIRAYALLHPDIRFTATVDGRHTLRTPGDGERRRVVAAVHGPEVAESMADLAEEGVTGMVSEPRLSRGGREGIVLGVNGRPISSRSLQFALEDAYLGALERGRYPVAVVDLAVDPALVDVNVHPAKREVRFRDERDLFGRLQRAVRSALAGSRSFSMPLAPSGPAASAAAPAAVMGRPVVHEAVAALEPSASERSPAVIGPFRALGQALGGYLVAESPAGVVLIDQHAAHERVLYNRLLARLHGATAGSQALLLPIVVDVDPRLQAAAADGAAVLTGAGFEIEDFGPSSIRVLAAPLETPAARIEEALLDLLRTLAGVRGDDRVERAAASVACHSAVRFGDPMDLVEQRGLLEELERAPNAVTCPHGRPTQLVIAEPDLRRHFRRNY